MAIKLLNILNQSIQEQGGKFKDLVDSQGRRVGDTYHSVEMDDTGKIVDVLSVGEKSSSLGGGKVDINAEYLITPSSKRNSPFNQVRGYNSNGTPILHKGIDYSVSVGTLVVSTSPGNVLRSGMSIDPNGWGAMIEIQHDNGAITRYAHMSEIYVNVGDKIKSGTIIGATGGSKGATGAGNSQGPHLHFEYLIGGSSVDPANF